MKTTNYAPPQRLHFLVDETQNAWLPLLLESYFIADQGIYEGIRRAELQGRKLACAKGCAHCCRSHTTIPIYPLELLGIYWFCIEQLKGELREQLQQQLQQHQQAQACPFLVDEACSIHPLRPLACRHFNVFDTVCAPGEDAFYTRRRDVLTPLKKFQNAALETMLPFHGIKHKSAKREAMKNGTIHAYVQVLQEVPWAKLAERMKK